MYLTDITEKDDHEKGITITYINFLITFVHFYGVYGKHGDGKRHGYGAFNGDGQRD